MGAVIYCRVSTKEQTKNLSLPVQQAACEEYCQREGWEVDRVFIEGESAKTAERAEFQKLLAYCRRNRRIVDAVVVYNLSRFARNQQDHHGVRAMLSGLGIVLRSVTEPINETPAGRLIEGIFAGYHEFDNGLKRERTLAGMREAAERGRWVWQAPLGYRNRVSPDRREKWIEPDPERAPWIRRGFETIATGSYYGSEVLERVNALGLTTRRGKPVSRQTWSRILQNPLYAGRLVVEKWGVDRQGTHEALVSMETFRRVQRVLAGKRISPPRYKRDHPDFPLRRFCRCGTCSTPLTGSRSTSKTGKRYPYYRCRSSDCAAVNIRGEALETRFATWLKRLQPTPHSLALLQEAVEVTWEKRHGDRDRARRSLERQLTELRKKRQLLLEAYVYDKVLDRESYDSERRRLERAMADIEAMLDSQNGGVASLTRAIVIAGEFLVDAADRWWRLEPRLRREFQILLFPEGVWHEPDGKFGTPEMCPLFNDLEEISGRESHMVSPTGFEPVLPA